MKRNTNIIHIHRKLYLRRMVATTTSPHGKKMKVIFYVYFDFQNTMRGTVPGRTRRAAFRNLLKIHPTAELFRQFNKPQRRAA